MKRKEEIARLAIFSLACLYLLVRARFAPDPPPELWSIGSILEYLQYVVLILAIVYLPKYVDKKLEEWQFEDSGVESCHGHCTDPNTICVKRCPKVRKLPKAS